jgi:hypothetical protein
MEVCGILRGDEGYTRTVLTLYAALTALKDRIDRPNKGGIFVALGRGEPVAAPIDDACKPALAHVSRALSAAYKADTRVLTICNPALANDDGTPVWPAIMDFFEANSIKSTKALAVSYVLIRRLGLGIVDPINVAQQIINAYPAKVDELQSLPAMRKAFYDSAGEAIRQIKTVCTMHPRLINFANDKMTGKVGLLRLARFPQTGGAEPGSAGFYAPPGSDAAAAAAAAVILVARPWTDCSQGYMGPNREDRATLCQIRTAIDEVYGSLGDAVKLLTRTINKSVEEKEGAMQSIREGILANNPMLATIAAAVAVRSGSIEERFTDFKDRVIGRLYTLFRTLNSAALTLASRLYGLDPSSNSQIFRDYGTAAMGGGSRRNRRKSRRARKTRRHH